MCILGCSLSLSYSNQVENWLLSVSAEDLNSTQETEEMKLTEQPGEGETAKQTVAPCHQLTGRVGLQASFVPPIIPLFEEVNVACDTETYFIFFVLSG